MSIVGNAIRQARRGKQWSQDRLAAEAAKLPKAPRITRDIVQSYEWGRPIVRLEDADEPLPFLLKALGLNGEPILRALGMEEKT